MGAIMGRHPTVNKNLLPRMRARKRHGGKIYYYYDAGGRPRKEIPLGSDYIAAVQKWAKLNVSPSPILPTVGYAITRYLTSPGYAELSTGTQDDYGFALDKLTENFGTAPLDQVKPAHLTLYLEKRSKDCDDWKGSKHRAQREVSILGMVFRYARSIGLTKNDPKESITLKKLPGRKKIYITDDMLDAVYAAGSIALKDAMDLAYLIGQRPADVLSMSAMNIKDDILEYRQGKTDTPQRIVIAGPLADLIKRIDERKAANKVHSLFLLVDERGKKMTKAMLRGRFEAARTTAGINGKDFQFRDLRRKSGSDLRDQKGLDAAQDLLGHQVQAQTEHYTAARGKIISAIPIRGPKTGASKA